MIVRNQCKINIGIPQTGSMQNDDWVIEFIEPLERRGKSPSYLPNSHKISIKGGCSRKLKSTSTMISDLAKIRREVQVTGINVMSGVKTPKFGSFKLNYHIMKTYIKKDLIETVADFEIKNSGETTEANLKFPAKISQIRIAMSQLSDVIDKSAKVNPDEALAAFLNLITSERLISPWLQPTIFSETSIDEMEKAKGLINQLEDSIEQIEADLTDDQRSDLELINSTINSLEELDVRRDKFLEDAPGFSKPPTTFEKRSNGIFYAGKVLEFPRMIIENSSIKPLPSTGLPTLIIYALKESNSPHAIDKNGGIETLTQLSLSSIDENCLANLEARRDEKISLSFMERQFGKGAMLKKEQKEFARNIEEVHDWVSDFSSRHPGLKGGAAELLGEYNSIVDSANEAMIGSLFFPKLENY